MKIKSITAPASGRTPFGPLPEQSTSLPTSKDLARAAKEVNNQEKGKAADEKYLGEEQNVDARVRKILSTTQAVEEARRAALEHSPYCQCENCAGPPW